jgi:hypothetical protein
VRDQRPGSGSASRGRIVPNRRVLIRQSATGAECARLLNDTVTVRGSDASSVDLHLNRLSRTFVQPGCRRIERNANMSERMTALPGQCAFSPWTISPWRP